jgi:hypothetical protein
MTEHFMPFGKYRGHPPRSVPTHYLDWFIRTCKLSSGLRTAVRVELLSRPDGPRDLPPEPVGPSLTCARCGGRETRLSWQQVGNGEKRIRAECRRCQRFVAFAPLTPANVASANATVSQTPNGTRHLKYIC